MAGSRFLERLHRSKGRFCASPPPRHPRLRLSESSAEMQVFVDLCGEATVPVCVQPQTTMADLKRALLPEAFIGRYSYFSFRGTLVPELSTVSSHGITDLSTLHLRVRVIGGGGDGGATGAESRDCYLNMYATKKPDKVDPNDSRLAKWSRCALSSEALKPPCVVDLLGNVYNKEALVAALLSKSLPKELKYIKGLKDMVPIHFCCVPGIDALDEKAHTKFQCPISGHDFNGMCKFYVLRRCGHVLSAKALKEVQSSSCLVCFAPFTDSDKLVINGTEEEVLELKHRLEAETLKKREKKSKNITKEAACDGSKGSIQISDQNGSSKESANEHENTGAIGPKRKLPKTGDLHAVAGKSRDPKVLKQAKKFKALDLLPPNATKEVYASIFSSSSQVKVKETYMCRALPLGRN